MNNNSNQQPTNKKQGFLMRPWNPKPSVEKITTVFFIIGVIFLLIGAWVYTENASITEVITRYDDVCQDKLGKNQVCSVTVKIPKEMKQPVFFYYGLDNFYQNLRRYLMSKSIYQMQDHENFDEKKAREQCDPIVTIEDAWDGMNVQQQAKMETYLLKIGKKKDEVIANPCGLVAKTFFNDTFSIDGIALDENKISWKTDRETKFQKAKDFEAQWQDPSDEHFIVWARTAGTVNFRKLWARTTADIPESTITVKIQNNYNQALFKGKKYFILTTSSAIGGYNLTLQISYLLVGFICIIIGFVFCFKKKASAGSPGAFEQYKEE